jgi:hypothetical protein
MQQSKSSFSGRANSFFCWLLRHNLRPIGGNIGSEGPYTIVVQGQTRRGSASCPLVSSGVIGRLGCFRAYPVNADTHYIWT